MSIIGIIANQRQTNEIKKEIEKEKLKLELIYINNKSIENIKNIKFEIVIIQDSIEKLNKNQDNIKDILKNTKYLLLNTDLSIEEEIFKDIKAKMLTYGLKQKSTITASSIKEQQMIVSIQRAFENFSGEIIEQQEIPVKLIKNSTKDVYNCLIKTAIINILGGKTR